MKEYAKDHTSMTRKSPNPHGLLRIADNRASTKQQANMIPFIANSSKCPVQRQTEISHTPSQILYWASGQSYKYQEVGTEMEAYLDPSDPIKGSGTPAREGLYKNSWYDEFVQGHLLNSDLGGKGVLKNLFPFSGNLNHNHSCQVEELVKSKLVYLINNYSPGSRLYYKVKVNHTPNANNRHNPSTLRNTTLTCDVNVERNQNDHFSHKVTSENTKEMLTRMGWGCM